MSKPLIYQHVKGDRVQVVGIFKHAMTGKMMIAIASTTHPDYVSVQPHSEFSRLVKMGIYKDAAKLKKLSRAERIQARAIAAKRAEEFAQESRQTSVG